MHDYARSVQHNKKRQHKKHPKAALPIWLLPLTLILVAALAFGLYKLTSVAPAAVPTTTKSAPEKPKKQPQKTASKQPAKTAQEQYDFYTMLPPFEFLQYARDMAEQLGSGAQSIEIFGPIPAVMFKRAGRFRAQLMLQCHQRSSLQALLSQLCPQLEQSKNGT